jgi:hypothetical protein
VQPHAQPLALPVGLVEAAAQAAAHLVPEGRLEQAPAELFGQLHLRRFQPAHVPPWPADAQQEVFQLQIGEGQGELAGGRHGRAAQHPRPVARFRALDQQVEVEIVDGGHDRLLAASLSRVSL